MTINGASTNSLYDIVNQQYTDTVVKAVERVNTGLKINSTADDSAAAVISISLAANSSSLVQGVENANEGLGLVAVSNKALDFQEDILNEIKDKLTFAKSTDSSSQEQIRTDIQSLLEQFDDIAASTSYNSNYTLQHSSSDNSESLSITLSFSDATSVSTTPIQSNSEGVNLTNLKNLASGELDYDTVVSELTNVETALETLNEYKDNFALTQNELQLSIDSLTNVQEGNKGAEELLTKADITSEQAIVDQYNLLVNSSKYAIVQANTTQERVLQLLTDIPEYTPSTTDTTDTSTTKDDDKTTTYTPKEENSYSYSSINNTNASSTTTNSTTYSSNDSDSS